MQKLPVPQLQQTIRKYLQTIHPFLSDVDYERSVQLAQQFEQGIGATLQERLVAMATTSENWLYDWWLEHSYMRYREGLALNVSFFFVFEDIQRSAVDVAAVIAFYCARFKAELSTMPQEQIRGVAQCMTQYQHMFNSCRVPQQGQDTFYKGSGDYFGVMYRNGFYFVSEGGTVGQFVATFEDIVAQGQEQVPVSALTAAHRDTWAEAYPSIKRANEQLVHKIQECSFIICLDLNNKPLIREEFAHLCWHNEGLNRWFDKTLQFVVFGNGRAGFIGEHSMQDATTPSRLCDYILENAKRPVVVTSEKLYYETCVLVLPEELKPVLDKLTSLKKQVAAHDVQIINYQRFGKGLIKKLGMSPDSFVQMAIQYGYFLMNGNNCATYESAGMKRYIKGRTETCRSVTEESVAFCHSHLDGVSNSQRAAMFKAAVKSHSQYMTDCLNGNGIDRHFLGLRLSLKSDEPLPDFFRDPAYSLSCHWTLSTSQIPSEHFEGYGWGEVVPDGYGVAYMVRENRLMFNIAGLIGDAVPDLDAVPSDYFVSNYKQMRVKWLRGCIEEALDKLYELFTATTSEGEELPVRDIKTPSQLSHKDTATSFKSVSSLLSYGLSLAYPNRSAPVSKQGSQEEELSGVMMDDLGLIQWSTRRVSGGDSSGVRLFRALRDLVMTPTQDGK